jgi:hypothetical protein
MCCNRSSRDSDRILFTLDIWKLNLNPQQLTGSGSIDGHFNAIELNPLSIPEQSPSLLGDESA